MKNEHLRYQCQIRLPGMGPEGQLRLGQAKVLVVGMGGLGCPAAQYLAAAGIGTLGVADFDTVSLSNLHRQVLYTPQDLGLKKVAVAARRLQAQNPDITVVPHDIRVTTANVLDLVGAYDLIIDGTDNFETRYLLNDACVLTGKVVIYGAIYQYEGQVAVWNVPNEDGTRGPNYRDLFPQVDALQVPDCADGGVLPPLAGMIGCLQAAEAMKIISGKDSSLRGKLLHWNSNTGEQYLFRIGNVTATHITTLPEQDAVSLVTPDELRALLASGQVTLADVRTDAERAAGHIGGLHLPADASDRLPGLTTKLPVVLYCASGRRSLEAARRWARLRPDLSFRSLAGGLKAWEAIIQG